MLFRSPEPARPLSAEAPTHRRPKTSFWHLHSAKENSPRAANNSLNAPRLRKATQAVFAHGPLLCIGQCREGLPLAPWALLLCWGSRRPKPTPHGFSFVGKQVGRAKAFCAQSPAMPPEPASPLSAEAPSHGTPQTSFWQLHSAKGKSPRAANNSPNAPWLRKAMLAVFPPALCSQVG